MIGTELNSQSSGPSLPPIDCTGTSHLMMGCDDKVSDFNNSSAPQDMLLLDRDDSKPGIHVFTYELASGSVT